MIPLILVYILLGGCAFTNPPLTPDEFGKAARCHWVWNFPYLCKYEPNRVTIDIERLQEQLDLLERYEVETFHKRSL